MQLFLIVLAAALSALKIAGMLTMSWWIILLPLYIDIVIIIMFAFGLKTTESLFSISSFFGRSKRMKKVMEPFEENEKFQRMNKDTFPN